MSSHRRALATLSGTRAAPTSQPHPTGAGQGRQPLGTGSHVVGRPAPALAPAAPLQHLHQHLLRTCAAPVAAPRQHLHRTITCTPPAPAPAPRQHLRRVSTCTPPAPCAGSGTSTTGARGARGWGGAHVSCAGTAFRIGPPPIDLAMPSFTQPTALMAEARSRSETSSNDTPSMQRRKACTRAGPLWARRSNPYT